MIAAFSMDFFDDGPFTHRRGHLAGWKKVILGGSSDAGEGGGSGRAGHPEGYATRLLKHRLRVKPNALRPGEVQQLRL
jgi:hypothetical protein